MITWKTLLEKEFLEPYYITLDERIQKERQTEIVLPSKKNVFLSLEMTPFESVKMVILGQDPYPNECHAHGLSFSIKREVTPLPKSLQNIFLELHSDLSLPMPKCGNLEPWARQGVLLLNSYLTVKKGQPLSHKNYGWEYFTDKVLETISREKENVVFLLLGAFAQKKAALLDKNKHYIMKGPHPSPLSAYRGFFGSKVFSKTNEYLKKTNQRQIDFSL